MAFALGMAAFVLGTTAVLSPTGKAPLWALLIQMLALAAAFWAGRIS